MRFIKWILLIVAILIVGMFVAAYAIVSSYDYNKLKPKVAQAVMNATGRELTMGGNINLAIGLRPALVVDDVSFQNAPWGSRPQMATIKQFEVNVALLPLLRRDIDIKRLILVEPDVLIETDKSGRSNLQFGKEVETPQPAKGEAGKGEFTLPALSFNKVQIENGHLTYKDGQSGKVYAVALESLNATAPGTNSPIKMNLKGDYNGKPFEADGTVGPLAGLTRPGEPWPLNLTAKAGGAAVIVDGKIKDVMHAKGISLNLTAEAKSIQEVAKLADMSGIPELGPFKMSVKVEDPSVKTYSFSDLKVSLGESDLSGSAEISLAGKRPQLTADLKSTKLDLRQLAAENKNKTGETKAAEKPEAKKEKIFSDSALPLDTLKRIDMQASMQADKILLPRAALNNLDVDVGLQDGALTMVPLKATVGGGSLDGLVNVRAREDVADTDVTLKVDRLDLGSMLKELNITNTLEGSLNADIQVKGSGKSVAALMGGLNGKTVVLVSDGKINNKYISLLGTDLGSSIFRLLNPFGEKEDYTRLDCLVSRFDVKDGMADSTVMVINTSAMNVVGGGQINLKTEEIDLALKPSPKEGVGVSGIGKVGMSLSELTTPFRLRGTLARPRLGIDTTQSAIAIGKAAGGAALLGPVGLAAPLVSTSSGETCAAAIEIAKTGKKPEEEKGVVKKTTEGVSEGTKSAVEGAGRAFKKLFGE